ncbi:MAG: sigma factor-like helix-turn-helix DNA-binding protein [Planctomycetota bacterium]
MRARLTARQQECLALHFYDGFNQSGIGKVLNINQAAVARHIDRGLRKLGKAGLRPRSFTQTPPGMTCMDTETLDKLSDDAVLALW